MEYITISKGNNYTLYKQPYIANTVLFVNMFKSEKEEKRFVYELLHLNKNVITLDSSLASLKDNIDAICKRIYVNTVVCKENIGYSILLLAKKEEIACDKIFVLAPEKVPVFAKYKSYKVVIIGDKKYRDFCEYAESIFLDIEKIEKADLNKKVLELVKEFV